MEESVETIVTRFMRLNQLLLGKSNYTLPKKYLVHRDALLDVLFAIYDECNVDFLRKNKNINAFIEKFRIVMPELKTMRVNLKDFEVKKVIGRGHFGTVNVVKEKATGDVYAMKVLCKQETLNQQNVAFYEEERDIMIKSSSPWLTKLQYAFQDNQNLYLVMEFHPGGDLVSLLQKHDYVLPEEMCKFYLAELVLAINSVHTLGYVHRDIKPDNILIDRTGHIKLADFGSAARLNMKQQVTSIMPAGTPDYIAPEVLIAMNAIPASNYGYGLECDWWSLGIVAYEMTYGSTPFTSDKVLFTYNNIMNFKKFFKLPPEASEVSSLLNDVIENLLKESSIRFGYDKLTAHELFLDIDWNNIRNTVPPFIPNVTSVDDTSNFDDFEPENRPVFSELRNKKEFSAKDLPFVGFTYTPSFDNSFEKSFTTDESSSHYVSLDSTDSFTKNRALIELQKVLADHMSMESSLKNEIQKLKDTVQTKEKEVEIAKQEKSLANELMSELQLEVQQMKELLCYERDHRTITEKKATQLVRLMKQKQKQDALLLKSKSVEYHQGEREILNLEDNLDEANRKIDDLIKEKADLLSELYDTKHMLLECQKKLSENQQDLLASELSLSMNNSNTSESLKVQSPIVEKKLVRKLERKNIQLERELEAAIKSKHDADAEILSLQNTISELNNKTAQLSVESRSVNTSYTENESYTTVSSKEAEESISSKDSEITDLEQKLFNEQELCISLQSKLQNSETELDKLQKNLSNMEDKIKNLEEEISSLRKQQVLDNGTKNENELSLDISCHYVRKSASRNDRQDKLLLSDMKHENNCLKTKIESLTSEVSDLKNNLKNKENTLSEMQRQLSEKKGALTDAQLELRASTRKEHLTDTLRERNRELREQLKTKEEAILEKLKIEEDLRAQIKAFEDEVMELKKEVQEKEKCYEIEKAKYEERLRTLRDTCEDSKDATQKYAKTQGQYEEITKQNSNLTKECEEKTKKIVQLTEEMKSLKNDLTKKQSECNRLEKINSTLKTACMNMENDLNNFEALVEARDVSISKIMKQKENLQNEIIKYKDDLKKLQTSFDRKEQEREGLMKCVQELSVEIENQASLHETELQMLQDQLNHYKKSADDLQKKTIDLQSDISSRSNDTARFSKKILDLEGQLCIIKEEAAAHITQISSLKSSNLKLTLSLEEAVKKCENSEKSIKELYNEKESEKAKYDHEKIKMQETISQQAKLIDFLQEKTENMEKKKRPIARLFGKKDAPQQLPQSRDLEKMLETERSRCRRLQDQLSQARAEKMLLQRQISNLSESMAAKVDAPATPNSRAMHTAITYSPSSKSDSNCDSNENSERIVHPQGMKHKIPHRFCEVMCMRNSKCCICLDSMYLGRSIVKCQECLLECHPKCASSLPKTCGLPSGFMQHFKTAVRNSLSVDKVEEIPNISEGWIKVPKINKHGWDRRYMRFEDSVLYIFETAEEKDPDEALLEIDFLSDKASITVSSSVSATELPYAANSDLPFVLKVESFPHTTCWPKRILYIMTSNFNEKQMWVSVLEKAAEISLSEVDSSHKRLDTKTIISLKGSKAIDPLCASIFDEQVMLLGATEGLYALTDMQDESSTIKKIDGIASVFQIMSLKIINVALLINGEDRELSSVDLDCLKSRVFESSYQPITLKSVANIKNCHLFAVQENAVTNGPFICCATSQTVIICQYDVVMKLFCSKKVISVNEPCSCIHFSNQRILFGTDIFYELDLADFSAKGFLDGSDASLAGLVYGAPQYRSFPVAILNISEQRQNEEYLLCFHEMGVFVDSEGRRTRSEDMKWSRLPLSFAYRSPYLFIVHFNSIEVLEIPTQTSAIVGNRAVIPVQNAQYLGWAHRKMSVLISSKQNQSTELILVNGAQLRSSDMELETNDSSSTSSSPKNNRLRSLPESEDLDFSFTSSIDQDRTALSEESTDS